MIGRVEVDGNFYRLSFPQESGFRDLLEVFRLPGGLGNTAGWKPIDQGKLAAICRSSQNFSPDLLQQSRY